MCRYEWFKLLLVFPRSFSFCILTQVTRDGHPVIHHDVAVDLGGVRIPVVSLTLQEFLVIRDANHFSQQLASAPTDEASSRHRNRSVSPRSRGKSDEGMLFARFATLAVLSVASNADFVR